MSHKTPVFLGNILKKNKAKRISLIFLMLVSFYVQGQNLEVVGTLKVVDGTQAAGKVLMSDADGEASWVDPSNVALVNVIQHLSGGVQALLSGGLSPLDLYNLGLPLDSLYGKTYAGGYVFYIDIADSYPFEGMVAAMSDLDSLANWGCFGTSIPTPYAVGTGRANTAMIANSCTEQNIGAMRCEDLVEMGYNDWFLPSLYEFNHIAANLYAKNIGNLVDNSLYLSSSEFTATTGWVFKFSQGLGFDRNKHFEYRVRPIREF